MIKRILALYLLFSVFSSNISAFSSNETDGWTLYPSYHNVTHCEAVGEKIYAVASGALYSYNKNDEEVRLYDKINTLSDIDITHIAYCKAIQALVIVYSNANIDILYNNEEVYNISDLKNKTLPDKKINGINIQGTTAYLSTSFGIVVLNLDKLEFENTYTTGFDTYCTYLYKDKLFCGTKTGMYSCDTANNMLDKNNWEKKNNYFVKAICELDGVLYCHLYDFGILHYEADKNILRYVLYNDGEKYLKVYSNGKEIIASATGKTAIITGPKEAAVYSNSNSMFILKDGNSFWDCKGYGGIVKCDIKDNTIVEISTPLVPNSPIRNLCEYMKATDDGRILVAGGNINYFDVTFHDGTAMQYDCNSQKWFNFPEDTIKTATGLNYQNICSIDEDPTEPGHFFAGSFGYGIYEFRDGKFIKHYNNSNSPLESAVSNSAVSNRYVRVSTVKFDNEGNLWCINSDVKGIVKVLKKDGTWQTLDYKKIEYTATAAQSYIDSRGWLWVTTIQGDPGLFCAKTNGTLFDTGDDVTKKWINRFTNQDGVSYDIYQLYDIAEDKDGTMWVGTNIGVFVIDDAEKFFTDGIFKQIKIARNDGTGLADYFMSGVYIKAIEVDGANRKWIGTNNNGVYLVSADAQETIHHFTTENSPLPSDCIESIAINHTTGEVFIGTDKGIASYMSDATTPAESLEKGSVHAYPNPVRADYSGNISIVGLTYDCDVKIVDVAGFLINEGTSNGGMYSWNGRNQRGEKVASGVYYVLTYDSNGKESVATKILVTR